MKPQKGAQPVPGPMRIIGSDGDGGGRVPLRNHAGISMPMNKSAMLQQPILKLF